MTNYDDDLAFLPLGGTGEIGMNLNLYRCNGQWLAVDCGLGFGGPEHPEVDVMVPDASFIAERRDKLLGLVITHAHEDHLGAVAWLWRGLQCPIYATPFAAAVLRRKLTEAGLLAEVTLHVVQPGSTLALGDFSIEFVSMAHSVPEAQALAITTPYGVILHSGDWKLDPDPVVGPVSDEATLKRLGDQGVLAMVCDSTNALVEGHSGSEAEVRRALPELIRNLSGRVAITCFASNVARLESIGLAAKAVGRQVAIAGRSLRNIEAAARECGYLADVPHFLSEDAAADVPDDRLLLILSGSQGEARSAMSRVALDTHPRIALGEGDTVIFSSRVIPGNERAVGLVQDNLVRRGVRLMTDNDHMVHVSGHPARDELRRIYALVRPKYSVPVHGEWRHLTAHAGLAEEAGAKPLMLEDGDILELAPGRPAIIDSAPVGRLAVDGNRLVPMSGGVLAARRRMLFNGVVIGSLVVDEQGRIRGNAQISAPGLFDAEDPERVRMEAEFTAAVADLPAPLRRDDFALAESAKASLRRTVGKRVQKRPLVDIHLMRIAG
ncbi:ribonuclease J [Acidisoma silvae]|uniref:Ribonuclease J n=1 Tax=Acidisoma silvae TaxID=2802396 RepID=A0A963YS03_9PROT|nr:ribonuclease J [Acidisoma silvae]MCB8875826.1 ribonuclease J [Acidisoma silvae]